MPSLATQSALLFLLLFYHWHFDKDHFILYIHSFICFPSWFPLVSEPDISANYPANVFGVVKLQSSKISLLAQIESLHTKLNAFTFSLSFMFSHLHGLCIFSDLPSQGGPNTLQMSNILPLNWLLVRLYPHSKSILFFHTTSYPSEATKKIRATVQQSMFMKIN